MTVIDKLMTLKLININKIFEKDKLTFLSILGLIIGDTGVFGGGYISAVTNIIDYVTISILGNATDFGDLTIARSNLAATSNGTNERGIFGGGGGEPTAAYNTIDYIRISTPSNATDFGDLTVANYAHAATSNERNERGIFGGYQSTSNIIDYVTISTPSNATDFGDLTVLQNSPAATSNGTNERGIFGGGFSGSSASNIIDYVTISTPSNATDFGDLTIARYMFVATSNGTNERGIFGGGQTNTVGVYSNIIDYVTISTPSNATDFGDLTAIKYHLAATSNGVDERGIFGGGYISAVTNIIDYVTISTPSNATDFGDLTVARRSLKATSNA